MGGGRTEGWNKDLNNNLIYPKVLPCLFLMGEEVLIWGSPAL